MKKNKNNKLAFSLIELSVVILIIGILIIGVSKGSQLLNKSKIKSAQSLTINSPVSSIKGLSVWLETTSDASFPEGDNIDTALGAIGTIDTWNDINPRTSSTKNATQGTAANNPRYIENGINGLPALNFDGAASPNNDNMELSTSEALGIANSDYEMFVVFQSKAIDGAQALISSATTAHYELRFNSTSDIIIFDVDGVSNPAIDSNNSELSPTIVSGRLMSNGDVFVRMNGVDDVEAVDGASVNSNILDMIIGSRSDDSLAFSGHIGEIIIFNRALTTSERTSVEEYLSSKWGIEI
ncbi:MAG: prepilin-type N-terminal cleavage/methylation domain-containing protein [Lentimonas sp.]|jgi:prepilin-type N-terminal cleavage/methylation domain-containing protein